MERENREERIKKMHEYFLNLKLKKMEEERIAYEKTKLEEIARYEERQKEKEYKLDKLKSILKAHDIELNLKVDVYDNELDIKAVYKGEVILDDYLEEFKMEVS
ncbi:hypothetical protein P0Y35_11725 [Kiritimatiellaeota bacterium B1221]|nr:hypothetical protein [Kiritimatiellaeota bacterium B1221]